MGYGFGAFILAVGLILALAVNDTVHGVDLVTVGWILAAVGAVVIVLTALTWNRPSRRRTTNVIETPDGNQSVQRRDSTEL